MKKLRKYFLYEDGLKKIIWHRQVLPFPAFDTSILYSLGSIGQTLGCDAEFIVM